jgi:hypothetical protein
MTLIDALGVSKEDYLDFVAQQHIYKDVKEGHCSGCTIRTLVLPLPLVLAIVGILFQVASVLADAQAENAAAGGAEAHRANTAMQALSPRSGI